MSTFNQYKIALLTGLIIGSLSPAYAHEHDNVTLKEKDHDFRQHDSHQHGLVEFNIAQDGNDLLIEVTAPASDVVGFEHIAETSQEKELVANATQTLRNANALFQPKAQAECRIEQVHVTHSLDHEDHEQEDHAHHHDHGHEDKQDDEHGTFNIEYRYLCDNIEKLTQIETKWFSLFSDTTHIDVNIFTERMQSSVKLAKQQTTINL